MTYYATLAKCTNPHSSGIPEYFDPTKSDSGFPRFFCSSRCEHDWVANRLQALTLLDVIDIQARASAGAAVRSAAAG